MFVAIYSFQLKPGNEKNFLEAWEALTILIRDNLGALGSRMHKSEKEGVYIAYAQWPSRELWERDSSGLLPKEAHIYRQKMKAACTEIKTIHSLEVLSDLLIHEKN